MKHSPKESVSKRKLYRNDRTPSSTTLTEVPEVVEGNYVNEVTDYGTLLSYGELLSLVPKSRETTGSRRVPCTDSKRNLTDIIIDYIINENSKKFQFLINVLYYCNLGFYFTYKGKLQNFLVRQRVNIQQY